MRVRDHIALSTAGAALLHPWLGGGGLAFWSGGVLIDADHYLWFCVRERSLSPRAAVDFHLAENPPVKPPSSPLPSSVLFPRDRTKVPPE